MERGGHCCFEKPSREILQMAIEQKLVELRLRLESQLVAFEREYQMSTAIFLERYERGELGDGMDFIEWDSTVEMLNNLYKQIEKLQK